jgi:hypothetical protein
MNKRFGALALLVAAVAAAAGLFASPSNSAANHSTGAYCQIPYCLVSLTATGPSPSTVKMHAATDLDFVNNDSVNHTVVFANGLCSITVTPGESEGGGFGAYCEDNFTRYAGSYAYTVDGTFPGMAVTTPLRRVVTLIARTHDIRGGTRLRLGGRVNFSCPGPCFANGGTDYTSVTVLARDGSKHPFRPIATVSPRCRPGVRCSLSGRWKLTVQPAGTTTYIAKVTGQLPQGRIWTDAKSRPFTVRIRS